MAIYQILLSISTLLLLIGVVFGIYKNKKATQLLKASLQELKQQKYALDQHAIVSIADKMGRITYANEKFLQISGYSLAELLGKDHRLLNSGYHTREFFVQMWQTISVGNVWEANICNRSKNGALYWVQSTIVPILNAQNQIDHYISIRTDITTQKEMEFAEIKAKEWQRTILNNLADGVYILDKEGRVIYMNSAAERLLGFSFEEIKHQLLHDMVHHHKTDGSVLPFEECPVALAVREDRIYQSDDEMFFKKTGEGFSVSVSCAPLHDNSAALYEYEIVGSVVCFRDITEQRAIKAELIRAKESAEQALHIKSDFLSTMSHEIRTPMNGVLGMTQLLRDTDLSETQTKYVEAIHNSADSLLCIINDILDFSKIESKKLELEEIDFDLPELVKQTLSLFEELAAKKAIRLNCEIAQNVPKFVRGDPNRLRQILNNLISNAIKFTPEGSVTLSIYLDTKRTSSDANQLPLNFAVKDTGIGIDEDTLSRLFQSFSQADSSTTRQYGGTGLGLAISKNLAVLMGGDIYAQSCIDEGSEFCLAIYLSISQKLVAKTAHSAKTVISAELNTLISGLRILVAEDNRINQEVIKATLNKFNCHVYITANGAEAYDLWRYGEIDVILMDCMMPEVDGYQATQKIRETEKELNLPRTHIIALTANAMNGDKEHCLEVGMDDYLTKPFNTQDLQEKLQQLAQSGQIHTKETLPTIENKEQKINQEPLLTLKDMGGDELVDKVLTLFYGNTPTLIAQLKIAVVASEIETVRTLAHNIKSSAANVGATELINLARSVEYQAREGEVTSFEKINALESSYHEAVALLKNLF